MSALPLSPVSPSERVASRQPIAPRPDRPARASGTHHPHPASVSTGAALTFTLAGAAFAVDLHWVREIRSFEGATPLPGTPTDLLGVIDLRGEIVPLLSLRRRLGHGDALSDAAAVIVLCLPEGPLGLVVDAVSDVRDIDPDTLREPPFRPELRRHLLAMVSTSQAPLMLLDPTALQATLLN